MKRMLFVVMSLGLVSPFVSAQDQPSNQPRTVEGEYGERGGYRYGGGVYEGGGYGPYGGYGRSSYGGMMGQQNKVDPRQTRTLVERWKASKDDGEREKVARSLREMLKVEFSTRLAAHEKEIKQLEEKVRQLRERLDLRREKQDEIVENRLQQLFRDAQGLGWGGDGIGGQNMPMPWDASGGSAQNLDNLNTFAPQPEAADLFGPQPVVADGVSDDSINSEPEPSPFQN